MRYAASITSPRDAEDLLTDATLCVCDAKDGRPWLPERGSFQQHMRFVIHDIASDRRKLARARHEVPVDGAAVERVADSAPAPDETVVGRGELARLRRLGAKLRERVAGDDLAVRVFDDAAAGGDPPSPAGIADRLGCGVREVYEVIRRLKRASEDVLVEDERAEEAKMRNLREAARAKVQAP
jgi:hypothetical protein